MCPDGIAMKTPPARKKTANRSDAARDTGQKSIEASAPANLAIRPRILLPPEVQLLMPGLLLTAVISAIALHTGSKLTYVTPLIGAMGLGMLLRNAFVIPEGYKAGILFSMRQVLRFAVALLGIRITIEKIIGLGWEGLAVALVPLAITFMLTVIAGRVLRCSPGAAMLIGTGTSICGASAILTAGAITRSKDEDTIVAISSVTVFGTISMLSYPFLFNSGLLPLSDVQYGHWAGSTIHEVAQVVTAAFAGGDRAGEIGILVKLTRVAALIPVAFLLSFLVKRGTIQQGDSGEQGSVAFPLFLFGFLAMVVLNSLNFFTPRAVSWIEFFDMFLLTMAMAGMGLETDFRRLLQVGFRPFFLSVFSTAVISGIGFVMIKLLIA